MMDCVSENTGILVFKVFSGGTIAIDLALCSKCDSRGCIQVCQSQGGPLQLDDETGRPGLHFSLADIERGKCNECLGCELECELTGQKALRITLPIAGFPEYLETMTQLTVYKR
jgi:hypothetical protein